MRASRQIEQLREEGENPDLHSYFARNFFPCKPTCQNASEIGRKTFDLLNEFNPQLGGLYFKCVTNNVKMVEKCPELTRQYRAKLTEKAQRFKETQSGNQNNFKQNASINDDC